MHDVLSGPFCSQLTNGIKLNLNVDVDFFMCISSFPYSRSCDEPVRVIEDQNHEGLRL